MPTFLLLGVAHADDGCPLCESKVLMPVLLAVDSSDGLERLASPLRLVPAILSAVACW